MKQLLAMNITQSHPKGLTTCFLTEMWERFGFYIIQGLLILYMTQKFSFSDDHAYAVLGGYTGLAYISPVLGGYLADHVFGFRLSVFIGGILFSVGYGLLALAGQSWFYWPLAIIVLGNGLFKPNISSLLGTLYERDDPRRDAGFTLFYVGINLGAFLATLSAGFIQQAWGWGAAFSAASIGLIIGLITFYYGFRQQPNIGVLKSQSDQISLFSLHRRSIQIILAIVGIITVAELLQHSQITNILLTVLSIGVLIYFFRLAFQYTGQQRKNILLMITLIITSVIFWLLYMQVFFSVTLFIERDVNRQLFGIQIPTIAFISLEIIFIFIFGPLLSKLWHNLHVKKRNPSYLAKFTIAFFSTALCFYVLSVAASHPDGQTVSAWWIVIAYFFITFGELLLSPIGLAAITELAPQKIVGMMMGIWFFWTGIGGVLAGEFAKLSSVPKSLQDRILEMHLYQQAFQQYALLALIAACVLVCIVLFKRRRARTA